MRPPTPLLTPPPTPPTTPRPQGGGAPDAFASRRLTRACMLPVLSQRAAWVRGINAIACKSVVHLQRDDERLGAEVSSGDPTPWVAVHDGRTGSVYLKDFNGGTEHWISSSRGGANGGGNGGGGGLAFPRGMDGGGGMGGGRAPPPLPPEAFEDSLKLSDEDEFDGDAPPPPWSAGPSGGKSADELSRNLSYRPQPVPTLQGSHAGGDPFGGGRRRGESLALEEQRLRDEHAQRMISQAEEHAKAYRDLQARVDAEELRRREAEEVERLRLEGLEAEKAHARYEADLAAWEIAEAARQLAEATDQIQQSLGTQARASPCISLHLPRPSFPWPTLTFHGLL